MTTILAPMQPVREAILAALKTDYDLTLLVPAARIYPQQTPATIVWPFIRIGAMTATPLRADCADGADVAGAVHCFTKPSAAFPDAEQAASIVTSHICRILDRLDKIDVGGAWLALNIDQAQTIQDAAEASAFHGFATFTASAL